MSAILLAGEMAAVRNCRSCGRPMAVTFELCPFCKEPQPALQTSERREARCSKCTRPYSSKLAECPFCADTSKSPYREGPPVASRNTFEPRHDAPLVDDFRGTGILIGTGLMLLLGAARGVMIVLGNERLGGEESSGLLVPCLGAGLVLAGVVGVFVSRALGAFDEGKGAVTAAFVGCIALAPSALTVFALLDALNGIGTDGSAKDVVCEVESKGQKSRRGTNLGWSMFYVCDVDGERLMGHYTSHDEPEGTAHGKVTFLAGRGVLGRWVRKGEPKAIGPRTAPKR